MSLLSFRAIGLLAERIVREAGGEIERQALLDRFDELDVGRERVQAALRLSVVVIGRLEAGTVEGRPVLRLPTSPTTSQEAA